MTLDDTGDLLGGQYFDPFGTPQSGSVPTFGFTGELYDAGLNNIYLRARWYSPGSGSFTSRDPFEGFDTQPYSLHPYQYGYANPALYTDPSGEYSSSPFEELVQRAYETMFAVGDFYPEYPIHLGSKKFWVDGSPLPDNIKDGRLDIVDVYKDNGYVYEIKKENQQQQGRLEIERYIAIYAGLPSPKSPMPNPPARFIKGVGFSPEWIPVGPNPIVPHVATIWARQPEPGVIIWKSVSNGRPRPLFVPEASQEKANNRLPQRSLYTPPSTSRIPSLDQRGIVTACLVVGAVILTTVIVIDPVPGDEALIPVVWGPILLR